MDVKMPCMSVYNLSLNCSLFKLYIIMLSYSKFRLKIPKKSCLKQLLELDIIYILLYLKQRIITLYIILSY